jgi:hypothetical protein
MESIILLGSGSMELLQECVAAFRRQLSFAHEAVSVCMLCAVKLPAIGSLSLSMEGWGVFWWLYVFLHRQSGSWIALRGQVQQLLQCMQSPVAQAAYRLVC